MRNYKRCLLILLVIFLATVVYYHLSKISTHWKYGEKNMHWNDMLTKKPSQNSGYTNKSLHVVHLDLKGAPPKMSYIKKLLPSLIRAGCNALLIEYEDMFPYTGSIANISAKNAYTIKQVRRLVTWAHDLGLEVIPLVQTFGHLEHALKLKEFIHLREMEPYPQEVCPLNPDSFHLVTEMITQVMSVHGVTRYIHLGGDEVFHIGICSRCAATSQTSVTLYTNWMMKITTWVLEKYSGIQPIIWDDMLRSWQLKDLKESPLVNVIQPMVWAYARDVSTLIQPTTWHWYQKLFNKYQCFLKLGTTRNAYDVKPNKQKRMNIYQIWVAGAFKGASNPTATVPNLVAMFENQKSWINFLSTSKVEIVGLVLTGWSRHDHFAVLCEILPSAIPSLFLNLLYIDEPEQSEEALLMKLRSILDCKLNLPIDSLIEGYQKNDYFELCSFPGAYAYRAVQKYLIYKNVTKQFENEFEQKQGWMTKYNVEHNFTSPWRLIKDFTRLGIFSFLEELEKFRKLVSNSFNECFDKYTIEEWLEQKVDPLQKTIERLSQTLDSLITKETWPRRPLN